MMSGEVQEKHFDRLPAFAFKDLKGNTVSSEQFRGKVLLVDVWATGARRASRRCRGSRNCRMPMARAVLR